MQNRTAMQWQPKIRKERKISQSNVILGEYQEVQKHPMGENKDKHHSGSTIVH